MNTTEKKQMKLLFAVVSFVAAEVLLLAFDKLEYAAALGVVALMTVWVSCGGADPACLCSRCGNKLEEGDPVESPGGTYGPSGIQPVLFGTCKSCGSSAQQ